MDWIFGAYGNATNHDKLSNFHEKTDYRFNNNQLYLAYGNDTKFHLNKFEEKISFLISGCGIVDSDTPTFAKNDDWLREISTIDEKTIIGHFAGVFWNNEVLTLFNDPLGQRTFYYKIFNECFYFSTRLDWLLPIGNYREINFHNLSAYWMLSDPPTYGVPEKGIEKLPPNSKFEVKQNVKKLTSKPWYPDKVKNPNPIQQLKKFTSFPIGKSTMTLGLSGGLDSRTLLSLLSKDLDKFSVYTFGHPGMFDVEIAEKIVQDMGLAYNFYNSDTSYKNSEIANIEEFIMETQSIINIQNYRDFSHFDRLEANLMIDGGKGEYFRRGLARKLEMSGYEIIANKEVNALVQFLTNPKPDIFSREVNEIMNNSLSSHVDEMLNSMPKVDKINFGNWVDLYNIRYRTPNGGAPSQARLDNAIRNYMPFIQTPVLSHIMSVPVFKRRDGKLNRKILKQYSPQLMKYRIARYNTKIPLIFNRYLEFAIAKIAIKAGIKEKNPVNNILDFLKEYIYDHVNSREFKETPFYNHGKIYRSIDRYYKDGIGGDFVSWFVTFDIWKRTKRQ